MRHAMYRQDDTKFHKSSFSNANGCVEVARRENLIEVRDSKNPETTILHFSKTEWTAFVAGVKNGEFDFEP
jgi:hypothetical protein